MSPDLLPVLEENVPLGQDVRTNINSLLRKKGEGNLFTMRIKSLFRIVPESRTEHEVILLADYLARYPWFSKFPPEAKKTLPRILQHAYCGPEKTVIKEGHSAHAMYFIINGNVTFSQNTFNPAERKMVPVVLQHQGPGDHFGEVQTIFFY